MKRLFTFFAVIMLVFAFSVSAFATSTELDGEHNTTADSTKNEAPESDGGIADAVADGSTQNTGNAEGNTQSTGNAEGGGAQSIGGNFFALLYEKIRENAAEIISSFTLIVTALLTLAYKKGLIPAIKGSLSAIGGAISSIKESTERGATELEGKGEKMLEAASLASKSVSALEEKLTALEERLAGIARLEHTQNKTELILACQIDALSEIFMSSALPEYKKEALSRKISTMREALGNAQKEN